MFSLPFCLVLMSSVLCFADVLLFWTGWLKAWQSVWVYDGLACRCELCLHWHWARLMNYAPCPSSDLTNWHKPWCMNVQIITDPVCFHFSPPFLNLFLLIHHLKHLFAQYLESCDLLESMKLSYIYFLSYLVYSKIHNAFSTELLQTSLNDSLCEWVVWMIQTDDSEVTCLIQSCFSFLNEKK